MLLFGSENSEIAPQSVELKKCLHRNCTLDLTKQYWTSIEFIPPRSSNDSFFINGKSCCKAGNFDCPLVEGQQTLFEGWLVKRRLIVSQNWATFQVFDENKKPLLCFQVPIEN